MKFSPDNGGGVAIKVRHDGPYRLRCEPGNLLARRIQTVSISG